MPIRLLLIDAMNMIRRIYAGIPGDDSPQKAEQCQRQTRNKLFRLASQLDATHLLVVFDGQGVSWRHHRYPDYKAHRSAMPAALEAQLPLIRQAFAEDHLYCYQPEDAEADDVIATLAVKTAQNGGSSVIVSTDQGYGQLLSEQITQYDAFNQRWMDAEFYTERHGIAPQRLPQLFALTGHNGNQIPGVPGIGPKTALSLLNEHPDLPTLLAADDIAERWQKKLLEHSEQAKLSLELAGLKTDLSLGLNLRTLRFTASAGHNPA